MNKTGPGKTENTNCKNDPLYNPATKSNVNPQMTKFKT